MWRTTLKIPRNKAASHFGISYETLRVHEQPELMLRARERVKVWTAANRDKAKDNNRRHQKERAEELNQKRRENYHANIERARTRSRLSARKQRARNPEKHRERARESARKSYHKDLERARAKTRRLNAAYRRNSPEKVRIKNKRWRESNRECVNAWTRQRRTLRNGAPGCCSEKQAAARIAMYGGLCAYCSATYEQLDHVIPLSRGGTNWPANLRPACARCNRSKSDKLLSEWKRGE